MLWAFTACAIFNVMGNLFFIPLYSYTASAIVSTLTEFLVAALGLFLTIKYVGYVPRMDNLTKITASGAIMALFLFVFSGHNFLLLAFGSAAVYGTSLWITKAVTTEELKGIIVAK